MRMAWKAQVGKMRGGGGRGEGATPPPRKRDPGPKVAVGGGGGGGGEAGGGKGGGGGARVMRPTPLLGILSTAPYSTTVDSGHQDPATANTLPRHGPAGQGVNEGWVVAQFQV